MNLSFEKIMKRIEWLAIPVGGLALILSIFGIDCASLTLFAGVLCLVYILYASYLWVLRPKFDWHLIHGHSLRKVIAFVLLTPSFVASFLLFCPNYSPQNLVYDENLYTYENSDTTILGGCSSEIFIDSVFLKAHNLYLNKDSIVMQKSKLPETITSAQEDPSIFWTVYYHFIDPGNQHMTTSQSGRGLSALIAILGVFLLNGLLVSSIVGWIDSRKEKWLKGEVKYPCFLHRKKHYVIIGGNDMVFGIVEQIFEKSEPKHPPYILIQISRDVEEFRRELFSILTGKEQQRIIIYYGNRISKEDISHIDLYQAEEVYILGEDTRTDDIESYHDTMNMECLKLISDNIQDTDRFNKDNKLTCRVMFEYQTSFNILQVTDIDGEKIDFQPFNYYETWAQNVLICQEFDDKNKCKYLPLEGFDGIAANEDKFVHLVVVGMSRMGLAMAIEAAHLAHYPNFETNKKRTRITFIDASMEQEKHFFMGRFKEMFAVARYRDVAEVTKGVYNDFGTYRWLNPLEDEYCESPYKGDYLGKDFIDIEWEFLNGSVENPNIQQYIADAAANRNAKLTIAICLLENSRAIAAAAYLPDNVYKSNSTLQVLVYQKLNDDLLRQINLNKRYHAKLKAFGMTSLCYNTDLVALSEFVAGKVGEAYDKYAWKKTQSRYEGKGLIADDYDYLSDYQYTRNKTNEQKWIKEECTRWIKRKEHEYAEHEQKFCYEQVKSELKDFQKQLKETLSEKNDQHAEIADKPKSAKMWSNKYNVYSMWTKFRCMRIDPKGECPFHPGIHDFDQLMLDHLGKMEHNRWLVEQLLLRYRPLKKDEQEKAQITDLYSSAKQKGIYKKDFAHLDICSNDKLTVIDYNVHELDKKLIEVLPAAYREYLEKKRNHD